MAPKTDLVVNRAGVSRTLSTRLAAANDLDAFARGMLENYVPRTTSDYWTYRRYMHDILCLAFLEAGIYHDETLTLGKLGIQTNDKRLNQQKPDLYTIELTNLEVGEVLLSYNVEVEKEKKKIKYTDLFQHISKVLGVQINYNVIAVDLTDSEWEDNLPKLPDLHMSMLRGFVSNLRYIHANSNFSSFRSDTSEYYALDKFRFELSENDLPQVFYNLTGSKETISDLQMRIESNGKDDLEDGDYLTLLSQGILSGKLAKRPYPHPEPSSCIDLLESWEDFKSSPRTTDKLPRILQLGSPAEFLETNVSFKEVVEHIRTTRSFGGYLDMVKAFLASEEPDEQHLIKLSLSEAQLQKEQLEGPGRKAALKRLGMKPERKEPRHISIEASHESSLNDFIQTANDSSRTIQLHEVLFPDVETMGTSMFSTLDKVIELHLQDPFSAVAKFYQRISQEIILNSMRRRKNRQYALCDSGFRGIFVLIAPGPQLRTESNVEFVKIVSLVRPLIHELTAPWHPVGDHWESDWLSVDTDRLKHWARAFDRTLISSVTCAERMVETGLNLIQACRAEIKYGNYALMVLTYLEDKQLTSLTNQTIRYLWMKSLGDKQFAGIMSKFPSRVGSVIQSVMLQRAVSATLQLSKSELSSYIKVPRAKQDDQTGNYDESTTGIVGKLPRLITTGGPVPISYNLNEVYWCMMYNKDRQNPSQDALNILDKILKEEQKFNKEIGKRNTPEAKMSYVFGNTTIEQDLEHVWSKNPESHYFSRRAVKLGLSLQSKHNDNVAPDRTWLTHSRVNTILSRNLSEFATFKASVKTICKQVDPSDLRAVEQIGKRTKAVELIAELVKDENLTQAFEVAMQFSGEENISFDVMIQIFKKGQIGGVREIMILFIKARVLFNIVEEICRLLSKSDKREILTKGKDKRLMMRGDYEEVLSQFPKGSPVQMVKNSYDMTTWAQKFIPTIFCSIHAESLSDYPHLKRLAYYVFMKHTNKMIEYPRRLVEMWEKHPEVPHTQPWLQEAKEKFLKDGVPYFRNHSNMCQGIPHYNSTVLALSCQSLRDALYYECIKQLGQDNKIRWKTRVGSDDKGDMIGIDMTSPIAFSQYMLFEQCAHASERLHSMELSVKSAAGNVMYELNSAFMANLETLSPTLKFSLASCDMVSTASCSVFVNEAYGRVRQLRENGGSSALCGLAHMLNMSHFRDIFRTGRGQTNELRTIFKTDEKYIPYDFGVYPFYDIDLQEVVGPEYHNYIALTSDKCPQAAKQLLFTPLSKADLDESFPDAGEMLLKKDHFGIRQGLIRQLTAMRRRLNINSEEVDKFFQENPFLIVRGPETIEETLKVIHSKLLTKGASEALRRTSPAIYLGRLSAFETARAWKMTKPVGYEVVDIEMGTLSELEEPVSCTYNEFITWGLEKAKATNFPIDQMMSVIFPQRSSYEVIRQFVGQFGPRRESLKKHSQAVRTWVVNSYNYNFSNSLKSILETSFGMSQLAAKEDVSEFRKLLGFNLDSYEGFINECVEKKVRPMDLFFYMSKIYKASRTSKIQAFASGPSTNALHNTIISIKRFSHLPNHEMILDVGIDDTELYFESKPEYTIETLKFFANLLLMEAQEQLSGPSLILESTTIKNSNSREWCETAIRNIKSVSGFDHHTRKVMLFLASNVLQPSELKEKLLAWKTLNYSYLKRQRKTVGPTGSVTWDGDLILLVNSGQNTFTLNVKSDAHYLEMRRLEDPDTLLTTLRELGQLLSIDYRLFFTKRPMRSGDFYLSKHSKTIKFSASSGTEEPCLNLLLNEGFKHLRFQDLDDFKVIVGNSKKTGAVFVNLEQRGERTATICHFPGSYYPATCPNKFNGTENFWYRGLRLSRLLTNRDWFYNYRLPAMQDSETTDFFRHDVNFTVVLQQTTSDKSRIVEYLQVMDEVNEEVFNINNDVIPFAGTAVTIQNFEYDDDLDVNDLFRQEMEKLQVEEHLTGVPLDQLVGDWADEVEENSPTFPTGDNATDALDKILGGEESGIKFVRSLGYKRPARKANFQIVSQMQQGHMLKERVLNMFFKNGSITSENRRTLPHYYIWITNHQTELGDDLARELSRVVINELRIIMGATESELKRSLSGANRRLEQAPARLMNYLYGEETDLFTQISQDFIPEESEYQESDQ